MKRRFFFGLISVAVLVIGVLLVRHCLLDLGMPDGTMLETLARQLRSRELTAAEAVAAFCRELMNDGSS